MLEISNVLSRSFVVHWRAPFGHVDRYKVDLDPDQGFVHVTDLGDGSFQAVVSGATPGIDYTVTVSSVSSSFSKSVSRSFTTNESLPDPPYDIVDEPIGATAIMLAWSVPLSPSGRIFSYVVKYKEVCPVQQASFIQLMTNSETPEFLLNNLKPGTAYKIQVAAENGAGIGAFGNFRRVVTAESAPGAVSLLSATAVNHTTANVTWFLPQQPNGKITQFRIIVKFARSGKLSKNMTLKADLLFPNTLTQCEVGEKNSDDVSSSTTPSASLSTSASAGTAFQSVTSENPGRVALQSASVLVTHLNPYTTYLCEGSAFTKEGEGQITSALFRTPEWIPEEPPQNLVFRNLTSKSFIINWDPPLTITGRLFYRVELRGPSGRISYNTTRDLRFFFVNLLPFIKYEVIVTPETAVGPGPKANVTVITSPEVPGKVSHLTATEVEAESVTLEWRKPRQPNGVITRYRINVLLTKSQTSVQNIILTENLQVHCFPLVFYLEIIEPAVISTTSALKYETEEVLLFLPCAGSESSLQVIDLTSEQLSYVVRQLIPYTDYIIRVSAFTIVGEGPPTNISLKTQQHVPSSVQNIIYKNLTSTSILLFWDPPAFHNGVITHYTIYYAVAMDTKKAFHKVTVNTNVTLTDLKKYTIYKVRLTASTAIGESSLSERDNIFVQTLEDGKKNYQIEIICKTAKEPWDWSRPEKPNGIIVNYEYGHGNLTSLTMLVVTEQDVPDGPPQNITYVHLSPSAVEVFFSPPTAPNGIIRFYTLYLIPLNGSEKRIINSTNVTAKITGLKTYEKYILKISASTSKGEGNQSESMYILTREDVPVSPPRSLASEQLSFTTVRLSWEPPLEPNGVILYYTVHVWSTTTQLTLNVTGTSALLTDLEHNREHHAFVTANTRHGDGGMKSNNITFRSSEGSPGEPPGNVSYVNISSTSVQVFWNSPYKPNGNLQYYTIYYRNTSGVFTLVGSVENANVSAQLDNLTKFSHYQLWVTASTPLGDGNQTSEMIDVYTVEDVPEGAVQNITSQNISSTSVTISWLPPLQPNGKVFYHIFWDVGVLESHSQKFSKITTDTSIRIEGLQMSTDYMISVTPATSRGYSENTTTILHIRTDVVPETSPANLTYRNLSTTAIQLSWNPISEMNDAILSYTIELNGPSGTNFSTTSRTSLTLTNLLPFTHYNVSVSANTSKGLGPSSSLTVLTEESVPSAPPQNLEIVNSSADSVLVRWKPSPKPNGLVQFYSFKIIESRNQSTFFKVLLISFLLHEAYLTGFELPGEYYISVSAFTKVGNGNQFSNIVIFRTNNSETVQNLHCYASSWQSVTIQWDPPLQPNGNITHYILIFENHNQTVAPSYRAYTFTDLQANTSYQFSVVTATSVGEGKGTNCIVSTLPAAEVVNIQSTFVTLRWKLPEIVPGYITFFRITVYLRSASCTDWETSGCVETEEVKDYTNGKEDDDDDTIETTVSGLKKFRWYRFRVAASTNADYGNYSAWVSAKTAAGYPDGPPENITVTAISHDTIVITWEQSAIITGPTSYLIDVITEDSQEFNITILKTVDQNKTCEIFGLKPFTRYSVTVIAFTGKEEEARVHGKASEPVIIRTLEAVPKGAPENFTLQEISDEVTKVYVSFIPPSNASGDINGYQAIIHKEGDTSDIRVDNLKIIDNNQSLIAVIEGLKGGNTYTIKVRAITGAGVGPQTSEQRVTMGIKAPPKPDQKPSVALDSSGVKSVKSTTIEIRMPNCYFRDDHGPVKTVQVIVTEIRGINNGNISTWYEAYLKKPKPYFANEGFANLSCDSKNKYRRSVNKETYIIGAEKSCQSVGSKGKICNGPLKPNKEYLFKFRATNFQMQFTDSEYSDPVRTLADGLSGRTIEIILAVTLCVLSIILLVVAIFVIARIRQKQKEGGTYSPREAEIIDTKSKLDQTIAVADLELKEETLTRPVNKKSFLQHVEDLCVNNNLKFQEEFSELPKVGQELTSSDADLPWNRSKNRFANIKPYNNNRVKLMLEAGIPGSDFINASYVSGYLCPNEFIASQGPLPGTVADFWRMIWETSSKSIIMLTQCFEKGRVTNLTGKIFQHDFFDDSITLKNYSHISLELIPNLIT
uniref:Protein tyrosine phosphatase receptor type Q n=1 Tax=Callorhinchus milii TaxID=7868 RepID=A0A4W3IS38_CALMI